MNEYYVVVTNAGFEALTNALNGIAYPAKYMAVGDSNGNYYEPEKTQTELKNEKYKAELYAKGKREDHLFFNMQIPPSEGDYTIREVGLFDENNTLLAVSKYAQTLKTKADTEQDKSISIELQIGLSSEIIKTIHIDESSNLITKEELLDELNKKANISFDNISKVAEIKAQYPRFCFNSGSIDKNGNANLLQYSEIQEAETLAKTLILKAPAIYTDGNGKVYEIANDIFYNASNLDNGEYSIQIECINNEYILKPVKNAKVYRQNQQPNTPKLGDLWQNTSVAPYLSYVFDGEKWVLTNLVEVGILTISSDSVGGGD